MIFREVYFSRTRMVAYWGLLHETGTWTVKWRLVYRMIMLFHNIMVGDEDRLAKEVLVQQLREGHEESFANQVLNVMSRGPRISRFTEIRRFSESCFNDGF